MEFVVRGKSTMDERRSQAATLAGPLVGLLPLRLMIFRFYAIRPPRNSDPNPARPFANL